MNLFHCILPHLNFSKALSTEEHPSPTSLPQALAAGTLRHLPELRCLLAARLSAGGAVRAAAAGAGHWDLAAMSSGHRSPWHLETKRGCFLPLRRQQIFSLGSCFRRLCPTLLSLLESEGKLDPGGVERQGPKAVCSALLCQPEAISCWSL